MILLSEFFDENGEKIAKVFKNDDGKYSVSLKNELGTTFSCEFLSEEDAEVYAEDWVLEKGNEK